MKTIMILPDCHIDDKGIPKDYKVVKRFIKKEKPDEIILLGDFTDMASLSHWDLSKKRTMEGRRFQKEIEILNKELDFLQEHSKKVTYIEGNHDHWLEEYLDLHPEMEGLIELPKVLNLKKRGIEFIRLNKLYKKGHIYFTHGMFVNNYHAMKHLLRLGCSVVYGHTHGSQSAMMNAAMQKPHMAYGLGCLCGHEPSYLKGAPANWISQFGMMYLEDNGNFNLYPVNIIGHQFLWQGKVHK